MSVKVSSLATSLFDYRAQAIYAGDGERVFPNPSHRGTYKAARYGDLFRAALKRAGVEGRVRPFHDLRHSSITNAAAAGTSPEALMSRAGHSDDATTRRHIDLSGQVFREEADMLEARLNGSAVNA